MKKIIQLVTILVLASISCTIGATPSTPGPVPLTEEFVPPEISPTETFTLTPVPATETFTPLPPAETSTPTETPLPAVQSLKAKVSADLLSCRYGPGAEYLYLIGFRKTTPVELIGRTSGESNWVLVQNSPQKCWVNARFLDISGDFHALPLMYPDGYKIPRSPYYAGPTVLSATRDGNNPDQLTVDWTDITLRAGDEEDENMFIYIIEVWRCEGGQILFEALASNYPEVTFIDEDGCGAPSHGRVFFQEKHGFAGPAEIPWPER
jgi:hypothetical protein